MMLLLHCPEVCSIYCSLYESLYNINYGMYICTISLKTTLQVSVDLYLLQGEGRAAMCKAVCIIIVKLADSNMKLYCCIPVCRHKRDILTPQINLSARVYRQQLL